MGNTHKSGRTREHSCGSLVFVDVHPLTGDLEKFYDVAGKPVTVCPDCSDELRQDNVKRVRKDPAPHTMWDQD